MLSFIDLVSRFATDFTGEQGMCSFIAENSLYEFDILHPYFSVTLDLYYEEPLLLSQEKRSKVLESYQVDVIDESQMKTYGRLREVPVDITCTSRKHIDSLLCSIPSGDCACDPEVIKIFYNILHGRVLRDQGSWLSVVQKRLQELPESFWINLKSSAVSRMTRAISLLEDSLAHRDKILFTQAHGYFLEYFVSVLFLSNKQFTPPLRLQELELKKLDRLPVDFQSRFPILFDLHSNEKAFLETVLQLSMDVALL